MAKFTPTQIYDVVNDVTKQAQGVNAIDVVDTSGLVSLGKELASDARALDMWFSKLWAKVGDTYIRSQRFEITTRKVMRRPHDFGLYVEKVSFGVASLKTNPQYDGISGTSDPYNATSTIPVHLSVFKSMATFRTKEPIPTTQLMTAFTDAYKMGAFISGLYTAIENAHIYAVAECANMAVNTNIASVLIGTNSNQKRNLLAEWNALYPNATIDTPKHALENADFLKWSGKEIAQTIKYLGEPSAVFNATATAVSDSDKIVRQTTKDNLVVEMLADFAKSYTTYLQSGVFNKELVELPNYEEVVAWQGSTISQEGVNPYDFDAVSSIAIQNDDLGETEIEQSGIVCFVHDVESCASTCEVTSDYTLYDPDQDRYIVYKRHTNGYAVDPTENAVVFYLAVETDDDDGES